MMRTASILSAIVLTAGAAEAATLVNIGSDTVVVQVSEAAGRMDLSLDPGASETVCPDGCFLTLPNGDRVGLAGSETVEIENGSAHVK
ncbi:hypothetical protein [Gellertiella hungarica]|uniref:Putative porin n=1 Tax=Gellertiella hungarica TaxID=1572859 RepID=A0A7W6J9C4_9HYPH|nr:hypothetical protein [Gellertiella hungarica]MBB4067184.1 putative porin [Gellertiella hungarica]